MTSPLPPNRSPTRVRFETRRRQLTVLTVEYLTPHLICVTLTGDLEGFQSPGFDDHVKLFFPDPVTGILSLPVIEAGKETSAVKPLMRDYTPRRYNLEAQTLDIEFALHDAGPATAWAKAARPGDKLHIGGPRGSHLIPMAFDHYMMIGDDTALPAIARRLEDLPAGTAVTIVAEVDSSEDRPRFTTHANVQFYWVYRQSQSGANSLNAVLPSLVMPTADCHVWVACEATEAKLIRTQLIEKFGFNPAWIKASGYWHKGQAGADKSQLD